MTRKLIRLRLYQYVPYSGYQIYNDRITESQTILGVYCGEVHLFPFRTEKLSPPAQMVLLTRESMSTPLFMKGPSLRGFSLLYKLPTFDRHE